MEVCLCVCVCIYLCVICFQNCQRNLYCGQPGAWYWSAVVQTAGKVFTKYTRLFGLLLDSRACFLSFICPPIFISDDFFCPTLRFLSTFLLCFWNRDKRGVIFSLRKKTPMGVLTRPSARPPLAWSEIFRRTCLQKLQTSPPTPQKSYLMFRNPRTNFENTPLSALKCHSAGGRWGPQ